jgi:hypothetical protein
MVTSSESDKKKSLLGASFFSRPHYVVMGVYDVAGNVIETHEHAGDFKQW